MKEVFTSTTKQALDDKLNEFIENHDVIDWPFVTIVTEIVKDETPAGYHWKATLIPKPTREAMEDLLVEEFGTIRLFWRKEDIQDVETYRPLTGEEVDEVAAKVEEWANTGYGINWDIIDEAAREVAPDAFLDEVWDIVERSFTPEQ